MAMQKFTIPSGFFKLLLPLGTYYTIPIQQQQHQQKKNTNIRKNKINYSTHT